MAAALAAPPLAEVETFAFADLFLADIRAYREERLAAIGRRDDVPALGTRAPPRSPRPSSTPASRRPSSASTPSQLDASFAGRALRPPRCSRDLPAGVDPCGENGEFHTFVDAGPIFAAPLPVDHGETVERDGFVFHDLRVRRRHFAWLRLRESGGR